MAREYYDDEQRNEYRGGRGSGQLGRDDWQDSRRSQDQSQTWRRSQRRDDYDPYYSDYSGEGRNYGSSDQQDYRRLNDEFDQNYDERSRDRSYGYRNQSEPDRRRNTNQSWDRGEERQYRGGERWGDQQNQCSQRHRGGYREEQERDDYRSTPYRGSAGRYQDRDRDEGDYERQNRSRDSWEESMRENRARNYRH